MKSLLLLFVLVLSTSASAQKHMIEFNADSFLLGKMSFINTKNRGESSQEDKAGFLFLNYAYTIAPQIQLGVQGNYSKYKYSQGSSEGYGLLVGGIFNFSADLNKAFYTSIYMGWDWSHDYDSYNGNVYTEDFLTRLSAGKRFPLTFLNLENVTYSPEVSFTNTNATKSSYKQWQQDLSFKFLQFSVLF